MNGAGHGTLSWLSHLNGALQTWVLPKACSVSLGRSFNPDVSHGVAKCMLFILASDFQSAEHFQLQRLLVGCEPRKSHAELGAVKPAGSDWARWDLTALSGSLLMVRARILDPIPGPGKPSALVGAIILPVPLHLILVAVLSFLTPFLCLASPSPPYSGSFPQLQFPSLFSARLPTLPLLLRPTVFTQPIRLH